MNSATDLAPTVFEAIVKRLALAGTYNHGVVTLAPHAVYTKHDELYVDAVTIERDGKAPKEEKIGAFKLAGLAPIRLTARRFQPSSLFDQTAERYAGNMLLAVEPA